MNTILLGFLLGISIPAILFVLAGTAAWIANRVSESAAMVIVSVVIFGGIGALFGFFFLPA